MDFNSLQSVELTESLSKAWKEFLTYPAVQAAIGELVRKAAKIDNEISRLPLYNEEGVRRAIEAQGKVRGLRLAIELLIKEIPNVYTK